jgi:hypothetical protein
LTPRENQGARTHRGQPIRHLDASFEFSDLSLLQRRLSRPEAWRASLDRRRPEHRRKMAAAQEVRRMTQWENGIAATVEMHRKGRTVSYTVEEISVVT